MSRWLRVRWRLDRGAALVLAVVAAPLVAMVWVAVRIKDGSPAVVRLDRVGRHGAEFQMVKFRSMTATGAHGLAAGPALTTGADPRVTALGRRLRHYRLDELPQLANVLRGEMALLGPRPETPSYVDLGDQRWIRVLEARPAIAGPTQVLIHDFEAGLGAGDLRRYESEMVPVKLAVDEWYLTHASPAVDLMVAWALIERFVVRRPATVLHRRLVRDVPLVADLLARHAENDTASPPQPAVAEMSGSPRP